MYSSEELNKLSFTKVKGIAAKLGIPNYTKYRAKDKAVLIALIIRTQPRDLLAVANLGFVIVKDEPK